MTDAQRLFADEVLRLYKETEVVPYRGGLIRHRDWGDLKGKILCCGLGVYAYSLWGDKPKYEQLIEIFGEVYVDGYIMGFDTVQEPKYVGRKLDGFNDGRAAADLLRSEGLLS